MYTIIGGDGKEYGPVTIEQIRAWIAGGRANLSTKVRAEGTDAWKSIADCPEITGSAATVGAGGITAAPVVDRVVTLDVMSCYERSWALLKANFWPLVGVGLLITLVYCVLLDVEKHGLFFIGPIFNKTIAAGLLYYVLLTVRGQKPSVGDAFAGFTKAFVVLVVIGILFTVFVTVGIFCLILPGIYLAVAYSFAGILAVDKRLGFWESMETSRKVITRNWWRVFGLLLLSIPLFILGALALGVGIFVAIPLFVGALVYAYEDLCNPGR
jgi:GYF domain 2